MKKIVVYYSLTGNVRKVAKDISEKTGADLLELRPKKDYPDKGFKKFFWGGKSAVMGDEPELEEYDLALSDYDMVIIGTPVWAGTFTPPVKTFIRRERDALSGKKVSFVASSSGGDCEKAIEKLKAFSGISSPLSCLSLVDPNDKPDESKEKAISDFCREIEGDVL